jgi:hypothetical protein
MTDNKDLRGGQDRAKVSGSEPYEVEYFANKHGISMDRAREIIRQAGNDRAKADQLANAPFIGTAFFPIDF